MKKDILLTSLLALSASTMAQELEVTAFRHVGPLPLQRPLLMDSTGVDGQRFSEADLLKTPLRHLLKRYRPAKRKLSPNCREA